MNKVNTESENTDRNSKLKSPESRKISFLLSNESQFQKDISEDQISKHKGSVLIQDDVQDLDYISDVSNFVNNTNVAGSSRTKSYTSGVIPFFKLGLFLQEFASK